MPSQIAETSPFPYWVEFVFNQFSMAVVDNVIVEYLFTIEFFTRVKRKTTRGLRKCSRMFSKSVKNSSPISAIL